METEMLLSQGLNCPILSLRQLKVEPNEENSSEFISWCKDAKVVDPSYLKKDDEESGCNDGFIEFAHIKKTKNEEDELDQKESDLCLKEPSYIKWEIETFQKIHVESSDINIGKTFGNDLIEPWGVKKETKDANEEVLNNNRDECPIKSEILEQEEVHIKHERDNEDMLKSEKNYDIQSPAFIRQGIMQQEVHIKSKGEKEEKLNKKTRKHGNQLIHQCPECPYRTDRKHNLKIHSVKHKRQDEIDWYRCHECPYKASQKSNLKTHAEIHNINNLTLTCSLCSYETLRAANLKRHLREHETNVQWLHCTECSFKTRLQKHFQSHSLTHKSDAFKCPKCSYQSKTKRQLAIHQVKHESMDQWHYCLLCPYKTYNKITFKSHCLRRHNPDPNYNAEQTEILKCADYENVCKRDFETHQLLIHNESRWLKCADCAYKTPYKRRLKQHQLRHQRENEEGWHKCLECAYKTTYKDNLRRHIILHKSGDEIRPFECSQCSYKTAYKQHLKRHQLKHKEGQEVEWFFCYQCSFKTKHKTSLPKHIWSHKKNI